MLKPRELLDEIILLEVIHGDSVMVLRELKNQLLQLLGKPHVAKTKNKAEEEE